MRFSVFSHLSHSRSILGWLFAAVFALALMSSGAGAYAAEAAHGGAEAHHGLPSAAPELPTFQIGPLKVTNSMILTWLIAAGIIIFARVATARMKEVPDGAQNFWEWMVESLRDFLESIIGEKLARRTFWFFASVFIFILFTNWFGLLPGVGTIGWGHPNEQGGLTHISDPLFRGVSADLNMTLAMALIFFGCWLYWSFTAHGFGGVIVHLFGNPARKEMSGILAIAMAFIFVIVGLLEVVSILFRPVSLSFRLYGNIFAGENLLESMMNLVPILGWLIPIPFYFMELLVGFVQALVFMLLTAVFTVLMIGGDDEHGHAEHH
jgi:F-type H+-transporting ATPase subunit a